MKSRNKIFFALFKIRRFYFFCKLLLFSYKWLQITKGGVLLLLPNFEYSFKNLLALQRWLSSWFNKFLCKCVNEDIMQLVSNAIFIL